MELQDQLQDVILQVEVEELLMEFLSLMLELFKLQEDLVGVGLVVEEHL
jgi:hypothetical protein